MVHVLSYSNPKVYRLGKIETIFRLTHLTRVFRLGDLLPTEVPVINGFLYNYWVVTDARNVAPAGWHVPTEAEWDSLWAYEGIDYNGYSSETMGGGLKETGYSHWDSPNQGATNLYGFSARGSGSRIINGITSSFEYIKQQAVFWASTSVIGNSYYIDYSLSHLNPSSTDALTTGISIRLIKDDDVDTSSMIGNDGHIYSTVKIGNQVWMAENLAETKYRNGDTIPLVDDASDWAALSTDARCFYNNDGSLV